MISVFKNTRWLLATFSLLALNHAQAATPDIFDITPLTGDICENQAFATFVDVNGDGTYNTLVYMATVTGKSEIYPDGQEPGNEWVFYATDSGCPGNAPGADKARLSIRFADRSAPGHLDANPATYTYKSIPAVELTTISGSVNASGTQFNPYLKITAYRNIQSSGAVPDIIDDGTINYSSFANYVFSDAQGIMEIQVNSDFAENFLDDLILHDAPISQNPSVALLLDTSGSMNWGVDGTYNVPTSERRITLARNAIEPFLYLMEDYGSNIIDYGVAAFPDINNNAVCTGWTVKPLSPVTAAAIDQTVNVELPGLAVMGNTPLLGGIDVASGLLANSPGSKSIVLLSDGYHNCPFPVASDGTEVAAAASQLNSANITLHAIGFGNPADVDTNMLENLAQDTSGEFYAVTSTDITDPSTDSGVELQETYKTVAVQSLGLQSIEDPIDVIKANSHKNHGIKISPFDTKVSFYVSWENCPSAQLEVELLDGNGRYVTLGDKGIAFHKGSNYWLLTLGGKALAARKGKSDWTLHLSAGRTCDESPLIYQYSVVGESDLKLQPTILSKNGLPGEKLLLMAKLTAKNEPVLGVLDVTVAVAPPSDEKGAPKTVLLTLYDDGSHGDIKAKDGFYSTVFGETKTPGTYSFDFVLSSNVKSREPFKRYMRVTKTLKERRVIKPE